MKKLLPTTQVAAIKKLKIHLADATSSSITAGFPSLMSIAGYLDTLNRYMRQQLGIQTNFDCFSIVSHKTEINSSQKRRSHEARDESLARPAAFQNEIYCDLELSLYFCVADNVDQNDFERHLLDAVRSTKFNGGIFISCQSVQLISISDSLDDQNKDLKLLKKEMMPGFVLTSAESEFQQLIVETKEPPFDLLMKMCGINLVQEENKWKVIQKPIGGWLVPISTGRVAINPIQEPGMIQGVRDTKTKACFVESVITLGRWVSPHRFKCLRDMFWFKNFDIDKGLFLFENTYSEK